MTITLEYFIAYVESVSGYIIGALIAGIIGVVTAFYDRKLSRKQRHLEDLQRQLGIISQAVNDPIQLFWPWQSPDTAKCPVRGPDATPNTYPLETYNIGTHQVIHTTEKGTIAEIPNKTLYEDFKHHFPKLSNYLEKWQEKVRMDGPKILRAYYDVCDALYDDAYSINVAIREKSGLAYYVGGHPYDAAALNIILGVDEKSWPNLKHSIEPQIGEVNDIVKKYKDRTEVSVITKLLDEFEQLRRECEDAIEEVSVGTNLRGKCMFL